VGLRRWGAALPVLWLGEMRLFCGAACSWLKERQLGLSAVWVAEREGLWFLCQGKGGGFNRE